MIRSDYLHCVLDLSYRNLLVKQLVSRLAHISFDAIAFSGMSGALIAPAIASALSKSLIMIRKEPSHTSMIIEGEMDVSSYIIIDDFIYEGNTIRYITKSIKDYFSPVPILKAICLYTNKSDAFVLKCSEHEFSVPIITNFTSF